MTVKQLIEFLKQYPENAIVKVGEGPIIHEQPVSTAWKNKDGSITLG